MWGLLRGDERGFTLIELLVVILIIGILAAIAIPAFLGQRARAQDAQAKHLVRGAASAVADYMSERTYTGYTAVTAELQEAEPSLTTGDFWARATPNGRGNGWLIQVKSTTGVRYRIIHNWPGTAWGGPNATLRVCYPLGTGGCQKAADRVYGNPAVWDGAW